MFWINFGRWNHSAGSLFISTRVYRDGYKWTPLIWVQPRWSC